VYDRDNRITKPSATHGGGHFHGKKGSTDPISDREKLFQKNSKNFRKTP
jgi:hypothetical protein